MIEDIQSPIKRLWGCQGSIQLVTGLVAANTCSQINGSNARDFLALYELMAPKDQNEQFARAIQCMAAHLASWETSTYLNRTEVQELQALVRKGGWNSGIRWIHERMGTDEVDELYLGKHYMFLNHLLLNAYRSARKIFYGDGIGINFSPSYFGIGRVPLQLAFSWPVLTYQAKSAVRNVIRNVKAGQSVHPPKVQFDLHCLLLPNLFDETISNSFPPRKEDFLSAFEAIRQAFAPPFQSVENVLEQSRAHSSGLAVLLTSNLSEFGKMKEADEIEAYRDFVCHRADSKSVLLIKPHPRDSQAKLRKLEEAFTPLYSKVIVIADEQCFYVPFEALIPLFLESYSADQLQFFCFSTSCLSIELLFNLHCTVGFGEELVRKFFPPLYVPSRLRHESDLLNALSEIRRARRAE